ncbi:MAG: hydroxymethylglutaryl-CoA lyase [Bdellovibrionales bacterium]|nr:hydroxymethylglutaryl-CoA lyase [Bdellovibrionales bacterium]
MPVAHIVEVGLRDGLQNEASKLSLKERYQLVKKLSAAGLKRMELGSFVSPKFVPQMKYVPELTKKVLLAQSKGNLPKNTAYSAFVPNQKGFEKAAICGLKELSFFISCTESFSQKNINMSIKDSLKNLHLICRKSRSLRIKVRVYLSAAFACPYEGSVSPARVACLADRIMQEGVFELSVSDTIGVAVYTDVLRLMNSLLKKIPARKIALHFHDTRGMALTNVLAGLETGVKTFDSSIGGLGGCPYAPGASGNVATEDLVYMLEKMKFQTGVQIAQLIKITPLLEQKLSRTLPAKLSVTGLFKLKKKF